MKHTFRLALALAWGVAGGASSMAQQPAAASPPLFTSRPIISAPITGDDRKQMILMSVAIQPAGAVPMHTHPGDCVGTVVEGAVELLVEGQAPRRVTAGEAYSNLRGTVHGFRNVGDTPARLVNSLVVDKGAPPVVPVATPGK